MKAAVWHGREDIRIDDVVEPDPAPDEIKVKVAYCGISGTDVHEYESGPMNITFDAPHPQSGHQGPVTMGHEFSGRVVAVGEEVIGFEVGDRVTANSVIECGVCRNCVAGRVNLCEIAAVIGLSRNGAFAEYVCFPERVAYKLPDGLALEHGALLEPVTTGTHALRLGRLQPGERVAVFGGGPIGVGAMQSAIAAGASEVVVVEPVAGRRDLAERLGARGIDPDDTDALAALAGSVDVVVGCAAPARTMDASLALLGTHGRLVVVAIALAPSEIDTNLLMMGERSITASAGRLHRDDFPTVAALIERGAIDADSMITNKIALEDIVADGFEAMRSSQEDQLKILVDLRR